MQRSGLLLFVLMGLSFVFPQAAHAYLDPGSGSMLLQIVLGGTAGLARFDQAVLAASPPRVWDRPSGRPHQRRRSS